MSQNYVDSTSHVTRAATSPVNLLARYLVLASVLPTHHSAGHILRFSRNLGHLLGSRAAS